MSNIYGGCKTILNAGELCIINQWFQEWLVTHSVVQRTTKSVLMAELNDFVNAMDKRYEHKQVTESILCESAMEAHVDNILLDMIRPALYQFCDYAEEMITSHKDNRIMLSWLARQLNEYVLSCHSMAVADAAVIRTTEV